MGKAYFLTDKDGNKIYPYGHADAVFTSDGNKVGDKLDDINTHTEDTDIHITSTERTNWNSSVTNSHTHSNKTVLDGITSALITAWNNAVTHVSDTVKHITSTERTNWDSAYTHSTSAHAPSNAEANQNAFSNVVVGSTTIAADSKTDSLTLVAGSNVTITPDATNDKITIAATDTTYNPATTSVQGLMSAEDKTKLDGIATGANKTTVDTALSSTSTNPVQNKVINTALSSKASTAVATTSANGLMSSTDKTKLNATNVAYATCSTAAATAAKVATISGNDNWTLTTGSIVVVKFTVTNSASNVTLNLNNTGAKSIWYNNAVYTGNSNMVCGCANRCITFMYDGTNWVWLSHGTDSNSTYSPAILGQGYGTCATAEATTAKVVTLSSYALVTGGIVAVKFTYAVPASATMNINSKGAKAIYHKGVAITAGVINAGDLATFIYNGSQYHLLSIDTSANSICETIASTEPTTQSNGDHWLLEY